MLIKEWDVDQGNGMGWSAFILSILLIQKKNHIRQYRRQVQADQIVIQMYVNQMDLNIKQMQ